MRPVPKPGLLLVATRELRWVRRDGVALVLAVLVPVHRLRHSDADIQQCGHSQSSGRYRRRRPLGDLAHLCTVNRLCAGRHRRRAIERHEDRDGGRPIRRRHRRCLHPRELRARSPRPEAAAGGVAVQPAILHPWQQRGFLDLERHLGGDRHAAAPGGRRGIQAGCPRRRAICPVEPGPELRPVPAAGRSADCAAHRGGDHRRLRRRLGVLSAQQTRLDARRWRPAAGRAYRQAHAFLRHFPGHDGGGRRHHPRPLRRQLPRRSVARRGSGLPPAHRLSFLRSFSGSADSGAADWTEPDRNILQSGVRLRWRRIPGCGDGNFPPSLGLYPAPSLVPAGAVRPSGPRRADF